MDLEFQAEEGLHVQGRLVRLKLANKTSITATVDGAEVNNSTPSRSFHISASSRCLTQSVGFTDSIDFTRGRDKSICRRSAPRGTAGPNTIRRPGQPEIITGDKLFDLFIGQRVQAALFAMLSFRHGC